jgi:hypothetical protein
VAANAIKSADRIRYLELELRRERGEALNATELQFCDRIEAKLNRAIFEAYASEAAQVLIREWAGVSSSQLRRLVERLELRGVSKTIDLPVFLRSVAKLLNDRIDALTATDTTANELERLEQELKVEKLRAQLIEMRQASAIKEGNAIATEHVRGLLDRLAVALKRAGSRLGKRKKLTGAAVQREINRLVETVAKEAKQA